MEPKIRLLREVNRLLLLAARDDNQKVIDSGCRYIQVVITKFTDARELLTCQYLTLVLVGLLCGPYWDSGTFAVAPLVGVLNAWWCTQWVMWVCDIMPAWHRVVGCRTLSYCGIRAINIIIKYVGLHITSFFSYFNNHRSILENITRWQMRQLSKKYNNMGSTRKCRIFEGGGATS